MEKNARIKCNTEFIKIYTISFGVQPVIDPKFDSMYFSPNEKIAILGQALLNALKRSRTLQKNDPEYRSLCWSALKDTKYKTDFDNELSRFKYKDKKSLYENMQFCYIGLENEGITLTISKHSSLEGWDHMDKSFDLTIPATSSPFIIGAAVKYSIARCTGKGADLVAKKLLPDGVPESFDDYLESLNLKN